MHQKVSRSSRCNLAFYLNRCLEIFAVWYQTRYLVTFSQTVATVLEDEYHATPFQSDSESLLT
jgi:hypothetical protein